MMLKLYKVKKTSTQYWEAWDETKSRLLVHWGKLGATGRKKTVRIAKGMTLRKAIAKAAEEARADGYVEIADEDHTCLVVQYKTKGWGSAADLDKSDAVETLLNECLGWTGNGRCDGNDIGSGTLNVFSDVVDPKLASKTVIATLKKKKLLTGATIAFYHGDDDPTVVYPPRFKGKFSII